MIKRKPAINYTSREFETIREDLVNYARQYYSSTYKDFNEASFGSLMLDTVAYVGDILSFYLDYQANESFLSTAIEYDNVWKLARQSGYKNTPSPSSVGLLSFYVLIPARATGVGPDTDYYPVIKKGAKFSSTAGNIFTLLEDVSFDNPNNQVVVGEVNSTTGAPTSYAIKSTGLIASGELAVERITVGEYEKFKKVDINVSNVSEIISVRDSLGNEYYEVDYLSQDTVFIPAVNRGDDKATVPNLLRTISVPRRFTVEYQRTKTVLQFGHGSEGMTKEYLDPSSVVLDMHGKTHITDSSFDPSNLISNDKLGISPSNTVLTVLYRVNTSENSNASTGTITEVLTNNMKFLSGASLSSAKAVSVVDSLEVVNQEPILGSVSLPSSEEIKIRAMNSFATQNRAVTAEDYIGLTYRMPAKFGSIKRANIQQDTNSLKRNLNLYVISEGAAGGLALANSTIKNNLKNWLNHYKVINDTIDILDAKIVNFGIRFKISSEPNFNKYDVLNSVTDKLKEEYSNRIYEIAAPISISDISHTIRSQSGVMDVMNIEIVLVTGAGYSDVYYDLLENKSLDGRRILAAPDIIFELKDSELNIKGTIV